ncbi:MAG: tRNA threonylcarbamoyladenosine dehydratase [Lachnospiraceae bacterium]|nr:tRNA threonylcarbamoyladenosine dehydratase [Lachnospiraceae bacterium]
MIHQFSRTELLLGKEGMERLYKSRVAVFGIGGVGGHCVDALARSGIGEFDLIDNDEVTLTNLNRQLVADHETIGRSKILVMKERILAINPEAKVNIHSCFFLPENADQFPFNQYDYVVDAVDTVSAKIELILKSQAAAVPVISSMGAGNKLDPTAFEVADIYQTSVCPLAKVMRRELKKRGVKQLKVVYSKEEPVKPKFYEDNDTVDAETKGTTNRLAPGSIAFVPSVVGLILAGEVIKDLAGVSVNKRN